jgi:DNA uptake protein ComE-like DNA-binding protein
MDAAETEAKERLERSTAELIKKHHGREERLTKTFEKQRSELMAGFEKQKSELASGSDKEKAQLSARIDELESELAAAKKAAGSGDQGRAKAPAQRKASTASKRTSRRKSASKSSGLDLNQATFEELRNLGLSVTQSARLIAYRDVRTGFESLDELEEIPGLSRETRSDLRKRVTLSS